MKIEMSKGKLPKWVRSNMILFVCVPLIIGIHYGWAKLQDNPNLIDPADKKELPIIVMYRSLRDKINEKLTFGDTVTPESQEK